LPRPKKKQDDEGAPAYMAQYCDMITQLVTFFIILLSMAHEQLSGFNAGIGSVREFFGTAGAIGMLPSEKRPTTLSHHRPLFPIARGKSPQNDVVAYAKQIYVADAGNLGDLIEARYMQSPVSVQIPESLLFNPGESALKSGSCEYLDRLISVFRDQTHLIIVNGYTDDSPSDSRHGTSDWELSALRANSVVRYMHDTGGISYARLSAIGHGPYKPIVTKQALQRGASNQRIEIMIAKPSKQTWTR